MLEYSIRKDNIGDDVTTIDYSSFSTTEYVNENEPYIYVTINCDGDTPVSNNDTIFIKSQYRYYDSCAMCDKTYTHRINTKIISVDDVNNTFLFLAPKYTEIVPTNIYEELDDEISLPKWIFEFTTPHCFDKDDAYITLNLIIDHRVYILQCLEYIDDLHLSWILSEDLNGFDTLREKLFPSGQVNSVKTTPYTSHIDGLTVTREQVIFLPIDRYNIEQAKPIIEKRTFKTTVQVPINWSNDVTLLHEDNVKEHFINAETRNSINSIIDMEKHVYYPVSATRYTDVDGFERYSLNDINTINFNLHFRSHNGDNWTVDNEDTWNCMKPGYVTSYTNGNNQSDLLSHLNFDNKDVKFQKNVIKKSFIRLMFYDSMNPANQNLLSYSTIYLDSAKLYSKYMNNQQVDAYVDNDGTSVKGIRVNREVDRSRLSNIIGAYTDEDIENYRLSTQITVNDKWSSTRTSEGFYVYLWADNDTGIVPEELYLKIEFNHAGYGRTIPMMAPYWDPLKDGTNGFKTKDEIKTDWDNEGYGIRKYNRYSYIRMKYMYDKENKRHVYFLDPEYYKDSTNNELNINLYEARVTF